MDIHRTMVRGLGNVWFQRLLAYDTGGKSCVADGPMNTIFSKCFLNDTLDEGVNPPNKFWSWVLEFYLPLRTGTVRSCVISIYVSSSSISM